MELKVGYGVIEAYKRLSYKVWYAFAEFVDNSTQSCNNYSNLLDPVLKAEKTILTVSIDYNNQEDWIEIEDNSIGMNQEDLDKALTIGKKPINATGRSKYGMGLKTAAFWFGDKWEIVTKKLGETKEFHVIVDLQELLYRQTKRDELRNIADRKLTEDEVNFLDTYSDLSFKSEDKPADMHYTKVKIHKLNRHITGKTVSKTKEYLKSMYRYDIMEGKLLLRFKGEILRWDQEDFLNRVLIDDKGAKYYRTFTLDVNGKIATGWAGILAIGSRRDAGFSLLQAKRVIQGWPDSYRPPLLFGDQEGGTNNLVNQRLFGEIFLDGFTVSHTKDEILFTGDDEEILDKKLFQALADYKVVAEEYRKIVPEDEDEDSVDYKSIVTHLFKEMQNPRFSNVVNDTDILPEEIIVESNEEYYSRILLSSVRDTYTAQVAGLHITIVINDNATIYEPYLVIRFRAIKDELGIIINKNHPHWRTMPTTETILNFIKHCIYDGISEWKANWLIGNLSPETIKMIKDKLLRHEMTIQ